MSDKAEAKTATTKPKKAGSFLGWLLLCLPIMMGLGFFYPPLMMILILMAPGWLSLLSDSAEDRALSVCVAAGTLAGAVYATAPYFLHVPQINTALVLMQNPQTWVLPLGGAAIGAALFYIMPMFVIEAVYIKNAAHRKNLEAVQKKLIEEWGEEVKG